MKHVHMSALAGSTAIPRAVMGRVRADGDPKKVLAELQASFEEFKKANDEKLKSKADVVIDEKVERISASVGDLQKAIDDMTVQLAAAKAGAGKSEIKDPEYSKAFAAYGRSGTVNAAMDKGVATEGGYLAPTEWDRTITNRLLLVSPMRQIARVQPISVAAFSKLFNAHGTGSGWVGETASRPETTAPALGTLTYTSGELYANPSATQGILDDAQIDLEQFIADEIQATFAQQEGIAFVAGNGTNKPNGFLTYVTGAANAAAHPWGAILLTTTAGAGAIAGDDIMNLIYSLPSAYTGNARFVMNRATQGAIRKLKDGMNNYLWQPSFIAGQPATIAGFPVTELPDMPNIATGAIAAAFGDFQQGYLILDRMGVRVLRDPYTNKPYVMFYTTKRVGGGLLNPDTIKGLKIQ